MKHFTAAVAVLALLLGGAALFKPVPEIELPDFGSASSPSVNGGCMDVNGVTECFYSQKASVVGSTTCSFKAPANASSTLAFASVHFTDTRGAAFDVEFGKAQAIAATTTSLGYAGVVLGSHIGVVASTTPVDLSDPTVMFSPNQFLNVKIGSTSPSTGLKGTCNAIFRVL